MTHPPFGPVYADCGYCSLRGQCGNGSFVTNRIGLNYKPGGLMLVLEFPEKPDVQRAQLLSGRTGQLLDALLEEAGISPKDVWITTALLTVPKQRDAKGLKEHVQDLYACAPRLDAETEAARPRVIVTLGAMAMHALTGTTYEKRSLIDNPCDVCSPLDRKIGPVLQCFNGECRHTVPVPTLTDAVAAADEAGVLADHRTDVAAWATEWLTANGKKCPVCATSMTRAKPKRIACPSCGGKKKRERIDTLFATHHTLHGRHGVVGAIFPAEELPGGLPEKGVKYVIPTYSPGMLLIPAAKHASGGNKYLVNGQYAARPCVDHLKKAHSLLTRDARFALDVVSTEGLSDVDAAQLFIDYTRNPGEYIVDIETDSQDGPWAVETITCVGFRHATEEHERVLVVDTRHVGSAWNVGNPLVDAMSDFFVDETKRKIFHNGSYDRIVMYRIWGFDLTGTVAGDTMVAHSACYPDEEHNLGFCAHELTDAPAWKGDSHTAVSKKDWPKFKGLSGYRTFADLALYNARDNRATELVWERLKLRAKVERVERVIASDTSMHEVCIDMEIAGLPLSTTALAKVDAEQSVEAAQHLDDLRQFVGRGDFEPTGKALLWALYDPNGPCKLPVLKTTDTGQPSADKEALQAHERHPFVKSLLAYRKIDYNLSHFVRSDALRAAPDGRLHPQWKVTGARTGRWTSEPNVQNWPIWMRSVFVAPEGRRLVGADQAQLEMRIMAALSGDENLIQRCITADEGDKLNPEKDPHSYVASLVFGSGFTNLDRFDPTHFKAKPGEAKCKCQKCRRATLRDIVKRVVYGLNYGAGAQTVLDAIYAGGYDGNPLDIPFIERVTKTYFAAFPGVPRWRDRQLTTAMKLREVRSPYFGRHRIFPLGEIEPSVVYNYPIQSGGADIMAIGLAALRPDLRSIDPTAMFIAQIHDAVYVECAEDKAKAVAEAIEYNMSFDLAFSPDTPAMKYVATADIGTNLATLGH